MGEQFWTATLYPHHRDRHGYGSSDNPQVIDPVINGVEGEQAGGCPKKRHGNQCQRDAQPVDGLRPGETELVDEPGKDHLEDGDEGCQARKRQGSEEEQAEELAPGHLRDDCREGHERESYACEPFEFTDCNSLLVSEESQR